MSSGLLKRYTGSVWDEFYPKTLGQNVYNDSGNTALLNDANKINTSFLPDFILGQLLNGGTVNGATVTLTTNGKSKLGITGTATTITLVNTATGTHTSADGGSYGWSECQDLYFVSSASATFANISYDVGDWVVSTASAWGKIDNNDAVVSVNGKTGPTTITLAVSDNNIVLKSSGTEGNVNTSTITVPYATKSTSATILTAGTPSGTPGNITFNATENKFYNSTSAITLGNGTTGNAATATKLSTVRTFALTGDVTGSVSTDLENGASIATAVANDSHTHSGTTVVFSGTSVTDRHGDNIIFTGDTLNDALYSITNNLSVSSAKVYYGNQSYMDGLEETPHTNDLWFYVS